MSTDERALRAAARRRTAIHEAAHAVVDLALGNVVEYASIRAGKTFRGVEVPVARELTDQKQWNPSAPVSAQPPLFRADVERRIITRLAGPIAAFYLSAPSPGGYDDDEDVELARQALADLAPRIAELVVEHELREDPAEDDEASARGLAAASAGARAGTFYLEWLRAEAEDLVIRYRAAILRVADALERHAVLSGAAIVALISTREGDPVSRGIAR